MGSNTHQTVDPANPAVARFLYVLEAMLVHGTKSGKRLLDRLWQRSGSGGVVSGVVAGPSGWSSSSKSKLPLPRAHFWLYALYHSHKDTLNRIEELQQVRQP